MVRYPQNNPSEIPKQPSEGVSPKVNDEIKIEKQFEPLKGDEAPKEKDQKVEQLQERLHFLEEKLLNLQNQQQVHRENDFSPISKDSNKTKSYKKYWIIASIIVPLLLISVVLINNLYFSTFEIEFKPKGFFLSDQPNDLERLNLGNLVKQFNLIDDLMHLSFKQVSFDSNGKSITVRVFALGQQEAKQMAEAMLMGLNQGYAQQRKHIVTDLLDTNRKEYQQVLDQLSQVLDAMDQFKTNEKYFLINLSSKDKLIKLAQENALDLEKNFLNIKEQLESQKKIRSLNQWSDANKVILEMYRLRLTDMEFRKFLIGSDFLNTYDAGMRTVETAVARLINAQAHQENLDEISASFIIRGFLLICRRDAIEAVLNRRFVVSKDELSGSKVQYLELKNKFEILNLRLSNLTQINNQMKDVIARGFDEEVVFKSPLKVIKY